MIFQFFSNSMIFPCLELFFLIFQVFQCLWEPWYKLPEDRKNSLWSDFSLIEIKNTRKNSTDQTATCFTFWEIWLVNWKYTWSCCHCILSICLQVSTYLMSLVYLIYCRPEPFQVKMLRNRKKTVKIIALHAWAVGWVVSDYSHYEKINTQSQWWTNQYTFSMLFSRADLRESMIFYDFFHGRCLHGCFHFSFTYEVSAAV